MTKEEILLKQNLFGHDLHTYIAPKSPIWEAIENAMEEYSNQQAKVIDVVLPKQKSIDGEWSCNKCGDTVDGVNVTFEEIHEGCGGECF
jgi:hypothetical protein